MKHIAHISRLPVKAQTDPQICSNLANDFQARLCFITELLLNFVLPVFTTKFEAEQDENA